jgi:hypothetical protein
MLANLWFGARQHSSLVRFKSMIGDYNIWMRKYLDPSYKCKLGIKMQLSYLINVEIESNCKL